MQTKIDTSEKALVPLFGSHEATIKKYEDYAKAIDIKDEDTLVIAEKNAGSVNDMLKAIEEKRKEVKKPYAEAAKNVDSFAKKFTEPLTKIKKQINDAIKNWKIVQEAAARAEAEEKQRKANELAAQKDQEADRISRIHSQLTARLYGGFWLNKEKQRKTAAGCFKPEDCDNLLDVINKSTPPADSFTHLKEDYEKMLSKMKSELSKHKARLIELNSQSSSVAEKAKEEIESAKAKALSLTNNLRDEMKNEIVKENRAVTRETSKAVKEAGKNVRNNLVFEVVDIASVPKEWLALDNTAVREWANNNKELVKNSISEGTGIINGIKFSIDQIHVTR